MGKNPSGKRYRGQLRDEQKTVFPRVAEETLRKKKKAVE